MLLVKNLVDTVLTADLKELVNDGNSENLNTVVSNLKITLNQYKEDIKQLAKLNFKILQPEVENSENLVKQINSLHGEISHLKDDLEENEKLLKNVSEIEEYKKLIDRIEMINKIVLTVDALQKYDECLEEFTCAIDNKNYSKCNDLLPDLASMSRGNHLISQKTQTKDNSESKNEILSDIIVFKKLNEDFTVQKERLWFELNIEWDKLIMIELSTKTPDTISTDSIRIQTGITQEHLNKLTVLSPQKTDQFTFIAKLKQFGKKFLQFCEENIISSSQYNIDIVENQQESTKTLRLINDQTEKLSAADLLELKLNQIQQILKFLCKNLFSLYVFTSNTRQPKTQLISLFSDLILKDFVQLIYEKLIVSIIPLSNFDYQLESKIRQKVDSFEASLKEMKFLDSKHTLASIFDSFKNNVEELYVRKKCSYIMEQSRELMKQREKFFELVKIDERSKNNPLANAESNEEMGYVFRSLANYEQEVIFSENKNDLEKLNLLRMQTCSISQIAQKTIESVYETLNEALDILEKANDMKNVSLLCIVARNLFEIYVNVIPTFYRDSLLDLPLLSAIAYNDFMYLGFHCLTITHQYKSMFLGLKENKKLRNLTSSDVNDIIENFSCLDLIPKLYGNAVDILNRQMERQRQLLTQFLNEDCNGIMDLAEGNNFDQFKRALQKCIFQLNKLSSLWLPILPTHIYNRVFGDFFNLILSDLIKSCLRLEDISSDDASYLEAAFTLLIKCVYGIFSSQEKRNTENEENEVPKTDDESLISNKLADLNATKYVKSWQRFNYLIKVLKANLQEIVDLWSESMGPLALYLDSEEVRHLIRALFMITDKRSAALAKIK